MGILVNENPNDKQYHDLLIATATYIHGEFTKNTIDIATYKKWIDQCSKASNDSLFTFNKLDSSVQAIILKNANDNNDTIF